MKRKKTTDRTQQIQCDREETEKEKLGKQAQEQQRRGAHSGKEGKHIKGK